MPLYVSSRPGVPENDQDISNTKLSPWEFDLRRMRTFCHRFLNDIDQATDTRLSGDSHKEDYQKTFGDKKPVDGFLPVMALLLKWHEHNDRHEQQAIAAPLAPAEFTAAEMAILRRFVEHYGGSH